ncbi:MAG: hypothetical protein FWG40_11535 [Peptococcaceae bacterium]|nr:hypothetical protein [Peptococcaceae bacterium]
MGVLAVYDAVGIQNYIFSSNKLAENVGASKLVKDIFSETLRDSIAYETHEEVFNWKKHLDEGLSGDRTAEIIYQGGGNAYVAFRDESTFQRVTKAFLEKVSIDACGIGIAVAAIETDFSDKGSMFNEDLKKLDKRLALSKGKFNISVFAGNQPITKQSFRTGLPVSYYDDEEYLSKSQYLKRQRDSKNKLDEETQFKDFDDLAFDKGTDSLIAIIHADGNNMGNQISDFMETLGNYDTAVPKMRKFSDTIDKCYENARNITLEAFKEKYSEYLTGLQEIYASGKKFPKTPLLKLVDDGDDTTIVICGRFALDFAVRLLREIEKTPSEKKQTACAGVVIFHSHYPFSEAYKLAEELCSNAKKRSRRNEGSYIDFQLHQSGGISDLSTLRDKLYTVGDKSILRRPWRVSEFDVPFGSEDGQPTSMDVARIFSEFEENMALIKDAIKEKKLPRNKIIGIRNAIGFNEQMTELAVNQLRDSELSDLFGPEADESGSTISKYAARFDVLEMMDTYENLLNTGGMEHG